MNRHLRIACTLPALVAAPALAQVCDGISEALPAPLTIVRVASGLTRPLHVASPPGDTERLFLVEQGGVIRILRAGAVLPTPFLDIQTLVRSPLNGGGAEQGLLGLAFHPDWDANGWLFVFHTNLAGDNVVARYTVSADPDVADPASRQEVLPLPHPNQSSHNGGMLAFGPLDGNLYVGTGDGGGSCDGAHVAQAGDSLNGKILRIDVDSLPYAIPEDNPFVDDAGFRDEIWAYGLRNPWRFSFDPEDGDLFVGDVGQNLWEEIDRAPGTSSGGENYGWSFYEGTHCPNPSCGGSSSDCDPPGNLLPLLEYSHEGGACSVTGGYVYRGCRMPALRGMYFFADFCASFIRSFRVAHGAVLRILDRTAELTPGPGLTLSQIVSFGVDARGEIYVVDNGLYSAAGGEVYKILPVLPSLEVSGIGALPFVPDGAGPWTWEDLAETSSHPIASYRVYRSDGRGDAPFDCVHQGSNPSWPGGDADVPPLREVFSYLITARNGTGDETHPGFGSDGSPRVLSGAVCPQ